MTRHPTQFYLVEGGKLNSHIPTLDWCEQNELLQDKKILQVRINFFREVQLCPTKHNLKKILSYKNKINVSTN